MSERYCVFRTDAIGDTLLTLPLASALKEQHPSADVVFCVRRYTSSLIRLAKHVDEVIEIDDRDAQPFTFAKILRSYGISTAVFTYPRPGLAFASKLAGIPVRIGTAYRWYSPIFTHKRKEHRRDATLHEARYNLNLLEEAGITTQEIPIPQIVFPPKVLEEAKSVISELYDGMPGELIILHPGSGGSAKDWSPESFANLAQKLLSERPDCHILVTGSNAEREIMRSVARDGESRLRLLERECSLELFAAILKQADLVAANSTGPLHIASILGVSVVGFYPNDAVMHPRRWAPLGLKKAILMPGRTGAGMDTVSVESALSAVNRLLEGTLSS